MSALHSVKIIPGSKEEDKFSKILESVGVDLSDVMCKQGHIFWTKHDEYILSDGLYRQIESKLEGLKKRR